VRTYPDSFIITIPFLFLVVSFISTTYQVYFCSKIKQEYIYTHNSGQVPEGCYFRVLLIYCSMKPEKHAMISHNLA
jgi:hypothetical protein